MNTRVKTAAIVNGVPHRACDCGATHRMSKACDGKIRARPTITIGSPDGAWRIPHLWVIFHGIPRASELPGLAAEHDWEKVT